MLRLLRAVRVGDYGGIERLRAEGRVRVNERDGTGFTALPHVGSRRRAHRNEGSFSF